MELGIDRPKGIFQANIAVGVVKTAGLMLQKKQFSLDVQQKGHPELGTSSFGEADTGPQELIAKEFCLAFPNAVILAEEETEGMPRPDPTSLAEHELVGIIDGRDGSTNNSHQLSNWSVLFGIMRRGLLESGVGYAPDARNLLVVAEKGEGVFVSEYGNALKPVEEAVTLGKGVKPIISFGVDIMRDKHKKFFPVLYGLPSELTPRDLAGSGGLGLLQTVIGRIDAIILHPQYPWDWSGPLAIGFEMQRLGADLVFYGYYIDEDGKIRGTAIEANCFHADHYRTDKPFLGIVAGKKEPASGLISNLQTNYGRKLAFA